MATYNILKRVTGNSCHPLQNSPIFTDVKVEIVSMVLRLLELLMNYVVNLFPLGLLVNTEDRTCSLSVAQTASFFVVCNDRSRLTDKENCPN